VDVVDSMLLSSIPDHNPLVHTRHSAAGRGNHPWNDAAECRGGGGGGQGSNSPFCRTGFPKAESSRAFATTGIAIGH